MKKLNKPHFYTLKQINFRNQHNHKCLLLITLPSKRLYSYPFIREQGLILKRASKTTGQFHSAKGTVVEAVGNLTGSTAWQQSGKEEHARGEIEVKGAETQNYVEGGVDRLTGKKDAVVGAVTGDRQQELAGK